jgi:dihydrofolate synthase / folylpolyglutamate synthase
MKVAVYKVDKVTSRSHDLFELLDQTLPCLAEGSVVAIAAKIVSLCEGRTVPMDESDKDALISGEAQWYLPRTGKYEVSFTVTHNMLIPTAGIDESNGNDQYILWPDDPQASANRIREHLAQKHGVQNVGVIITDSTTRPLQWGTTGVAIAYSGFNPLKDYIGQKDIFGRELQFQKSNIANGLAAAAVTLMGEGNEQTPIALLEDISFVEFQKRNPTEQELADLKIDREDDLYWPLLKLAPWERGKAL